MKTLLASLTLSALVAGNVVAADPPNIVFFFTDDQRFDTLGCAGHPIVKTPTIDGLAEQGVMFTQATVSQSICWMSRTTILTGLTGRSFGVKGSPEAASEEATKELYTDILRTAGYRTGYYGKWHAKMPKGFKQEDHFDEIEVIGRNPFFKKLPDGTKRHETELIVDRGIDFIKSQPKGKPFALNMWFNASHAEDSDKRPGIGHFPWPKAVDGLYENLQMPTPRLGDPAIYESQPEFFKTTLNRERFFWRWDTPEKYQTNMRAYLRMITGIDGAIARFLKELEAQGLADNTIVIYTADNGYYMGDRGFAGKWTHYEQSLRVPMIVFDPRKPKSERGLISDAMVQNLDLPATILDLAGADVPERFQGRSFAPIVASGKAPADWRTETFHEHYAVRDRIPAFEGLRNADYKYVRYFDEKPAYEMLHDLANDPDELVNLASDPKHTTTLAEMRARLAKQVDSYGGPLGPYVAPPKKAKKKGK